MSRSEFQLGPWHVQPNLNLIGDGQKLHQIEPIAMDLLVLLAAKPGELVRTDEIISAVWSDAPMADNPVYKTIAKLRQALGDDSRNPEYIETISKRGYRLIAPVSEFKADTPIASRRLQTRRYVLAGGLAVFATLFVAWLYSQSDALPPKIISAKAINVGALTGNSFSPRYAPHSAALLFVNDNDGHQQIWLREADGQVRQLTSGQQDKHAPAWHPDGKSFLFVSENSVYRQGFESADKPSRLLSNATNPDWSPDGKRLVFERDTAVWLANEFGRQQTRLSGIPDRDMLFRSRQPRFSVDGERILYFEATDGPLGDFWEVSIDSGRKKQLTKDTTLAGNAQYTRDGKHILFNSQRGGSMTLWSLPVEGGEPNALLQSAGDDSRPSSSADGRFIVFETKRDRWALVVRGLETGLDETYVESSFPILAPVVSPNKKHIAYFALGAGGDVNVHTLDLTSRDTTLYSLKDSSINTMPVWSGDSRYIYFYSLNPTSGEKSYRKMPLGGGSSSIVAEGWQFSREHDVNPSVTGDVIAMAKVDGFQVVDALLIDTATGSEESLNQRLSWFDWSQDNQRFLATDFANSRLPIGAIVLCSRLGNCDELSPKGQHPVWSADEQSVYFAVPASRTELEIRRIQLADRTQESLGMLSPIDANLGPFFDTLGPNELVWVRWQETRSELWQLTLDLD